MQSFLITSTDTKKAQEYVLKMCEDEQISGFDITTIEPEAGKSIGIEEIRNIQKKIYLTPVKSKTKAIIIKNSETLTIEAQNAFLKILEEPPQSTLIILIVSNKDLLLSTIISRCKIIEIKEEFIDLSEEEITQNISCLTDLLKGGTAGKLKLAQDFGKTKEEAIIWLKKMILSLRHKLINQTNQTEAQPQGLEAEVLVEILKDFQETYTILSTTNVSPRLALENTLLKL